jgi:hypothetical protein
MRIIASLANRSVRIVALLEVYDSMAWVKASIPLEEVTVGGIERVNNGSTIATFGRIWGLTTAFCLASTIFSSQRQL